MFYINRFQLNSEGASAAPASSPVPTSAPVNSSSDKAIPTTNDLFKNFEDKFLNNSGKDHDENMFSQDDSEDIVLPSSSESIEDFEAQQQANEPEEKEDDLPLYVFQDKFGEKEIELRIETEAQLKHYLKRAAIAPEIFKENKQLRTDIEKYKTRAADAEEFDRMAAEEPIELLNAIVEDMKEEDLVEWVRGLAQQLDQDQAQKEYNRKLRQAEYILKQQEILKQQQEKLQQQRAAAIEQENVKQVQNWMNSEFDKWSSKLPSESHAVLKDMINDQLAYASRMAAEGHDVDLISLSNRLARYANTIIGSQKNISKKVGQATQAARQQATTKLQASANKANLSRNSNSAGAPQYKDTNDMFNHLLRKVGTGEIKLKG